MRAAIVAILTVLFTVPLAASGPDLSALEADFNRIIRASRVDTGVGLIHIESGAQLFIQGDRRFPMASVYKLPIAVELLAQVAQRKLSLDREVFIGQSDVRACCTISRHHPNGGVSFSARELLEMMLVESDNTAADAALKLVGGPPMVQRRLRSLGFENISVDRYEGDINFEMTGVTSPPPKSEWTLEMQRRLVSEVTPTDLQAARQLYVKDPRDSASPNDMARFLAELQAGVLLPRYLTAMLLDLMSRSVTGPSRLKGLLPPDAVVAHKTGTTEVVINDVGIITLPDDGAITGHLALAVFVVNGRPSRMQRTIAQLSGAAYEFFSGRPLPKPVKKVRPAPVRRRARRALPAQPADSRSTE